MGALVLDSSVLIGFIDGDDAHHDSVVRALRATRLRGDRFVLPATALSEILVGRIRRQPSSARSFQTDVIQSFGPVRVVDEDVAYVAAQLRAGHRALRLPDALVIATGVVERAAVLTCDKRWAVVDQRVQVVAADSPPS